MSCIYTPSNIVRSLYVAWRIYDDKNQKEIAKYKCNMHKNSYACENRALYDKYIIEADGVFSGNLTILNASQCDSARYRCAVDNGLESAGSDVQVIVVGK